MDHLLFQGELSLACWVFWLDTVSHPKRSDLHDEFIYNKEYIVSFTRGIAIVSEKWESNSYASQLYDHPKLVGP